MYGLTRGTTTLLGAGLAGLLIWLAAEMNERDLGEYWALVALLAAAGLVMALSQLLGGWTKWGWPRFSTTVLVLGFLPVLVVSLWVILAAQPESGWLSGSTDDWAADLGLEGVLENLVSLVPVLAFGTGLVFGFSFDTTGPRTEPLLRRRAPEPAAHPLEQQPGDVTDEERAEAATERPPTGRPPA